MFFRDVRYTWRQFRRAPGFALTVILTLALSVGVATAVFCVIDTVILRPLPYAHPERIVDVQSHSRSGYMQPASWPSYLDERAQTHTFAALAAYNAYGSSSVETPLAGPVLLDAVRSTDNFFDVFGVQPFLGRTFLPGEQEDEKNNVVVLGYDTWLTYFGGERGVIGRAVKVDGATYTIIGVMPAGFRFPLGKQNAVYTPQHFTESWMKSRGGHWLRTIARLKDGATLEQAQTDLSLVFSNIGRAFPDSDEGRTVHLAPLADSVNEKSKGPLWTLLGAVLAVLLIGCVNVAGLLLARGVKREREMAMRTAIGAGRARLVRMVLTESLLLAAAGAVGGIVLAAAMLKGMRVFLVHALSRGADIQLNWTVLAAAISVSAATSLAAALYPALRMAGTDPNRALKSGGSAGSGRGQHRLRAGFVISQVALTLVLLVISGMLVRMVGRYRHAELGFDPAHILAMEINLSPSRYTSHDPIADFYQPLFQRVSRIPGVKAAGVISVVPIKNWGSNSELHIAGQPPYGRGQERLSETRLVSSGYFDVMGIPLHRGRMASPSMDTPDNPSSAVVVNEAFVKKFIPDGMDAVGQRLDDAPKQENWTRIVGVVGNIRQDIYEPPMPEHDYLIDGMPVKDRAVGLSGMNLMIRAEGDPASIIPALRDAVHQIDPTVPFKTPETMTEIISETLVFERMESWLFSIFAGFALLLALVGLYGLISHEVEQSERDIGVRMALGASRPRILTMVLRRVAWMLGAGVLAGLVLTVAAHKLIGIVIYFEAQKESAGFLLLALLTVTAGLLAALIPAVRAASIEPMRALKSE